MKFRKKPIVIEAIRAADAIQFAGADFNRLPYWLARASRNGIVLFGPDFVSIKTADDRLMKANEDDWIIQAVNGEIYLYESDVFAASYDPV